MGRTKGPAIRTEHQDAVGGVDQRHACREQDRQHEHGPERETMRRLGRRYAEQRNLGRGIESEPGEEPDWIKMPATRYESQQWPKQAREESAIVQQKVEIGFDLRLAAAHRAKRPDHGPQHNQVRDGQHEQEQRRHAGADQAAEPSEVIEMRRQCGCRERYTHCQRDNHRRVAEREEQAGAERTAVYLEQLARDVIDSGDVVRIHRMAQPERVR
jgi:hypothetical protein